MFVQNLNAEQQSALLAASQLLIASDGDVSEEEQVMLNTLASQCELGVEAAGNFEILHLKDMFNTQTEKSSFMLELIGMAFADADYHETEQSFIFAASEAMELAPDMLADMESWVKTQLELSNSVTKFMGE